jgi:hypothetical protein
MKYLITSIFIAYFSISFPVAQQQNNYVQPQDTDCEKDQPSTPASLAYEKHPQQPASSGPEEQQGKKFKKYILNLPKLNLNLRFKQHSCFY